MTGPAALASFVVLSDKPEWLNRDSNHEVDASKRASLLQATMPPKDDSAGTLTNVDHTKDPLLQFLRNAVYLHYNGLGSPELGAFLVKFFGAPQNHRVSDKFMSSPSIAIKAFTEELFLSLLKTGDDQAAAGLLERDRVTPHALHLTVAACAGCIRTVELLLKTGIDPNSRPAPRGPPRYRDVNATALELAIESNHISVAKKLVDYGANPNILRREDLRQYAFFDVISKGNTDLLRYFLQSRTHQINDGAGPDYHALRLVAAAEEGNVDMVKVLLPNTDVNQYSTEGCSALVAAALKGKLNVVEFLLEAGASPNRLETAAKTNLGPSPLQAAIHAFPEDDDHDYDDIDQDDLFPIIRLLIEYGADVNEPPNNKENWELLWCSPVRSRTALQAAAEIGHEELFFYLLDKGADAHAPATEHHGLTALQAALRNGNQALWEYFSRNLGNLDIPPTAHAGTTALIEAARSNNVPAVRRLLESGCDVNDTGSTHVGWTALSVAILTQNMALVQLLLDSGAYLNHPQALRDDGTALQAALSISNLELVKNLIALGADVFDEKAFLIAVAVCPMEIIATMLAEIEARELRDPTRRIKGQLALQVAIKEKDVSVVLKLLQSGINPNRPSVLDKADACAKCENLSIFGACPLGLHDCLWRDYFSFNIRTDERALATAIRNQREEMVELLLQNGADVEFRMDSEDGSKLTPLASASGSGLSAIVQILLAHGADVNAPAKGRFGRTPLQAATANGHFDIIQLLLDRGADCNGRPATYGGATALQLASIKGYFETARMFLNRGADPNASAARREGRTALEGAAEHGRLDVLQLLLNSGAHLGEPDSVSYRKVCSLAEKGCHFAAIDLLRAHEVTKWKPGQFNGDVAQDVPSTAETWQVYQESSSTYDESHGHCSDSHFQYSV